MGTKHPILSNEAIQIVAERFKVMSDPLRLQILNSLQDGELSVSEIVEITGASQPNISKHLKTLQIAGLVGRRQEGNLVYYRIADDSIFALCEIVCDSVERRLKKQSDVLATSRA